MGMFSKHDQINFYITLSVWVNPRGWVESSSVRLASQCAVFEVVSAVAQCLMLCPCLLYPVSAPPGMRFWDSWQSRVQTAAHMRPSLLPASQEIEKKAKALNLQRGVWWEFTVCMLALWALSNHLKAAWPDHLEHRQIGLASVCKCISELVSTFKLNLAISLTVGLVK